MGELNDFAAAMQQVRQLKESHRQYKEARDQRRLNERLREETHPSNFEVITPPVKHDRWSLQYSAFTFGVPFGWRDLRDDELAALSHQGGSRAWAGIAADRTDQRLTRIFITSSPPAGGFADFYSDHQNFTDQRREAVRGTVTEPPRLILLCGAPAMLFKFYCTGSSLATGEPHFIMRDELWVIRDTERLCVCMEGPEADERLYWPVMETVLGTWRWRTGP